MTGRFPVQFQYSNHAHGPEGPLKTPAPFLLGQLQAKRRRSVAWRRAFARRREKEERVMLFFCDDCMIRLRWRLASTGRFFVRENCDPCGLLPCATIQDSVAFIICVTNLRS